MWKITNIMCTSTFSISTFSDVSTSLPKIMHTLSLYIIPPSSNSYASPVFKKFSISSITYGDAQSIIPTTFIPFLSAHSFAMFAKFNDLVCCYFYWFSIFTSSYIVHVNLQIFHTFYIAPPFNSLHLIKVPNFLFFYFNYFFFYMTHYSF